MQRRGRAMAVGVLLPLLAAGPVSCDGIIGLTDPSVVDAEVDSALVPDVEEPADSNETSTEEEAGADEGPTGALDAALDATTPSDSTVTLNDASTTSDTTPDTTGSTSGSVTCSMPAACGNTGTTYTVCTFDNPDGGCEGVEYQILSVATYTCASCSDCTAALQSLQSLCTGAPPSGPATVILLNSSPQLPSVRYCLVVSGTPVAPILPIPDRLAPGQTIPGIDLWTGAPIPSGLGDPATTSVVPYVLRSEAIPLLPDGGSPACSTLVGDDGEGGLLVPGVDFWALPVVPAGTFPDGTTGFLLLHGCLAATQDPTGTVERCGTYYDGGNDLRIDVYPFTPITDAGPTYIAARVLQGSKPLEGVLTVQTGSTTSEIVSFDGVSPTDLTFTAYAVWDGLPPAASSLNVQVVTEAGAPVTSYSWTLADIAQTTTGSTTAADGGPYYTSSQAYTFVIVGDPSAPADSGALPHAIVFPDNLVPPTYP